MEKLKDIYNSIIAFCIVGFIGSSFIIGSMYIIMKLVEVLCSVIL